MTKWIENGCRLAWLINPENETVQIFRENGTEEMIQDFDKILSGENILSGFKLNLKILKKMIEMNIDQINTCYFL